MTNQIQNQNNKPIQKNIKDRVLNQMKILEQDRSIEVPSGYSMPNAMQQAWLDISQDQRKMDTTDLSKAEALMDMVTLGLDPGKSQCYFIPYGKKLTMMISYHGNAMLLKRDGGALDVVAQVVYESDDFEYEIDPLTAKIKVVKHKQRLGNRDNKSIIGAYATVSFKNSEPYTEIMTMEEIEQSWKQSSNTKNNVRDKFTQEMVKKTVLNRAAKRYINSSSLSGKLNAMNDVEERNRKIIHEAEIEEQQGNVEIDFDDNEHTEAEFKEVPDNVNQETGEIFEEVPVNENESSVMSNFTQKPVENMDEPPF